VAIFLQWLPLHKAKETSRIKCYQGASKIFDNNFYVVDAKYS